VVILKEADGWAMPICWIAGSAKAVLKLHSNPVASFNDAGLMLRSAEQSLGDYAEMRIHGRRCAVR